MPAKYRLRYLPIAQEDLVEIFDDIAQDSPDRALSFVEKLDKKIRLLEHHPLLDRVPRHSKLQEYGYRVLILESHLIFSILREKTVEVHRVIHGSRNIDHLV